MRQKKAKMISVLSVTALFAGVLAGCGGAAEKEETAGGSTPQGEGKTVTISLLTDNTQDAVNQAKGVIEAFEAKYPNIQVEHETRPGGGEGDNLVKTRLATGDMTDVFWYNAGSLMQALNPEQNLVDLTNEPFMKNVVDSFKPTVMFKDKLYAGPLGSTMGGGWLYNKKVYSQLGLSVPKTWAELMANNEKIKAAGITPVIGSFKDDWTTQIVVLADYYNVQAQTPKFADDYTANKAKFADTPAALRSFEKLEEIGKKGYFNKDFLATTYDAGLKMIAEGKGAHYPMLTFAIPAIEQNYPEQIGEIGFFAQPGDSPDVNGLTVWVSNGAYIYKKSEHIEEAKKFVEFTSSIEGIEALTKMSKPSGPLLVKEAKLPDNVPQVVKDMMPYFDTNKTAPALEFVSPIKGPSLAQITTEVGAGFKPAKEGAQLYDKDVEKQAKQLGLQGW
ncbi:raffinose/stachyose/melibiose transport system substrate-binding protein [Paenibacillus mucilaginosus]|uniref:ABC transporter substrate-binding protein n=1 Tax=Paenibacillus mucilaginosus TaxID=61624 RepID=UPI003D1C0F81